jgi:ABC-type transporter Mla subunit MlaD
MNAKGNYFKIGAFILSALAMVVIGIVVLGGGKWLKKTTYWETYFDESVQGLAVGAPIKYRGVQVGTVKEIDFVGNKYRDELTPDDHLRYGRYVVVSGAVTPPIAYMTEEAQSAARFTSIGTGLRVRLASQGVTGVVFLEVDYLDPQEYPVMEVPWNPALDYVPSAPSTMMVLGTALHHIARGLEKADLQKIAGDLEVLLMDMDTMIRDGNVPRLSSRTEQMLTEVHNTARQIRRIIQSPEIQAMIEDAAKTVKTTRPLVVNLSHATKQIMEASEKLPGAVIRLDRSLQRIDRLISKNGRDLEETLEHLQTVSAHLRDISENARRYPAQVFFGEPPPPAGAMRR